MPTWKKVIVSGSQAELAAVTASIAVLVGTNQQITTNPATTTLSGSFSGSFRGDGSLITGISATTSTSASVTAITNQTTGTSYFITFVASGAAHQPQLVNSGSGATSTLGYNATTNVISATASWATNAQTAVTASYVLTAQTASYVLNAVTASYVLSASYALSASSVPVSTGIAGLGTNVATFLATPTSANLRSAITDEVGTGNLIFSNNPIFTGSVSASNDVWVGGNLTVAGFITGSATIINSTNVAITDQFILLASGSTVGIDGGIIVSSGSAGLGEALYYENNPTANGRWAIASNISPTALSVAAAEYVVTATSSAGNPINAPTYGGTTAGNGQIYIRTDTGDIFIYA